MPIILLENIRSTLNVGSIFRTADATGVEKIILVGYTPSPIDRMGRIHKQLHKTALGAEESVPWECISSTEEALKKYTSHTPIVVEQTPTAIPYHSYSPPSSPLFLFGNEVDGISASTKEMVALHIHLPMRGVKESLNVSVCAGIILYHYQQSR